MFCSTVILFPRNIFNRGLTQMNLMWTCCLLLTEWVKHTQPPRWAFKTRSAAKLQRSMSLWKVLWVSGVHRFQCSTWEGLVTEAAVVAELRPLHRVRLQVSQQPRLWAERLVTHRAGEVGQPVLQPMGVPVLGRLEHLVTPAAGETSLVQVCLLVIGQAG